MTDLRNTVNRKEIPEDENLDKVTNIVETIFHYNKQEKGQGRKMLTPKQMLQRLPIALQQVKAGFPSENLLNEIRSIICSLY